MSACTLGVNLIRAPLRMIRLITALCLTQQIILQNDAAQERNLDITSEQSHILNSQQEIDEEPTMTSQETQSEIDFLKGTPLDPFQARSNTQHGCLRTLELHVQMANIQPEPLLYNRFCKNQVRALEIKLGVVVWDRITLH